MLSGIEGFGGPLTLEKDDERPKEKERRIRVRKSRKIEEKSSNIVEIKPIEPEKPIVKTIDIADSLYTFFVNMKNEVERLDLSRGINHFNSQINELCLDSEDSDRISYLHGYADAVNSIKKELGQFTQQEVRPQKRSKRMKDYEPVPVCSNCYSQTIRLTKNTFKCENINCTYSSLKNVLDSRGKWIIGDRQ